MRREVRVAMRVALLLGVLLPGIMLAQGPVPPVPAAPIRFTRGWPLDRDGMVKMFLHSGRIRVIGWDRDSISVTGTISRGSLPYGGGGRRGVKFGIEGNTPDSWGDLTVRVPAGAVVWVRGAATDITVSGLTGGVDVGCVSGQVRITGDPRELTAEAMDGGLEIIGSPGTLRAKTASASLLWIGHAADATLGSVSGRIEASRGPMGRVRIETISGDVTLDAALNADADVLIESHSGSVSLRVPSGVPTRLTVDAARITGAPGRAPPAAPAGKRAPARTIDLNGASATTAAAITVRSFKGELTLLPLTGSPPR